MKDKIFIQYAASEFTEATENRHYGPLTAFIVLVFWGVLIALFANAVDCSTSDPQHSKADGWK